MRYSLTPNQPCDMDATRRVFAASDARWRGVHQAMNQIDIIRRIKLQRKQEYPDRQS